MSCKHYNFYQRPFIQSHEINAMPGAGVAAVSVAYCDHNGSPFCRIHAEKALRPIFWFALEQAWHPINAKSPQIRGAKAP
jgi:hypothetical protein